MSGLQKWFPDVCTSHSASGTSIDWRKAVHQLLRSEKSNCEKRPKRHLSPQYLSDDGNKKKFTSSPSDREE